MRLEILINPDRKRSSVFGVSIWGGNVFSLFVHVFHLTDKKIDEVCLYRVSCVFVRFVYSFL